MSRTYDIACEALKGELSHAEIAHKYCIELRTVQQYVYLFHRGLLSPDKRINPQAGTAAVHRATIVELRAQGLTFKEIAAILGLKPATVRVYAWEHKWATTPAESAAERAARAAERAKLAAECAARFAHIRKLAAELATARKAAIKPEVDPLLE